MLIGAGCGDVTGGEDGGVAGAPATVTVPAGATSLSSAFDAGFGADFGGAGRLGFAATRGGGRLRARSLAAAVSFDTLVRRPEGDAPGADAGADEGAGADPVAGFDAGADAGLVGDFGDGLGADRQADKSTTLAMATSR
jgi:hypothetical protein